ncbi:hypothetical protein KR093_005338 [Drosophila rubida]|uniref:C2H2-type domain-containing protein n=1 Tax=Drosophila rubida TaxID=30044 RepID=A0AAD4PKB7_9MUSC|nr:hypothetical protein KR093_005338 [Drosophila rubida]
MTEYLARVMKTRFEVLNFEWETVCQYCSLEFSKFENLLNHVLESHQLPGQELMCPIGGCSKKLRGCKYLAMHLVLKHAQVTKIPIFGVCPECKFTFSDIFLYNRHSCAYEKKRHPDKRLYCKKCKEKFINWKRYTFHKQFHLSRHRPRACFLCDYVDDNINNLFQHVRYSHVSEGTLFCTNCDRSFYNIAALTQHKKNHERVCRGKNCCNNCMRVITDQDEVVLDTPIICEYCDSRFTVERAYKTHLKMHFLEKSEMHICNNCGLISENREEMLVSSSNYSILLHC